MELRGALSAEEGSIFNRTESNILLHPTNLRVGRFMDCNMTTP